MRALQRPTFATEASKRIYQYVERHGTANRDAVRRFVSLPPDEFRTEVSRLKSKGYLEEEGTTFQLALDVGAVEEYTNGDLTYTIRPGRHEDFDGLIDTIRDVTSAETYVVAESIAEQLLYEDAVTRHNTVESRVFFLAIVDDEVAGWTHLSLPQIEKLQDTAQLTVGVREAYRGEGIGSQLLHRAIDWAEANGFKKVYNSVPAVNEDAMSFLERHGWNTEAIRKDHYTLDDRRVDEVMMAYRFD